MRGDALLCATLKYILLWFFFCKLYLLICVLSKNCKQTGKTFLLYFSHFLSICNFCFQGNLINELKTPRSSSRWLCEFCQKLLPLWKDNNYMINKQMSKIAFRRCDMVMFVSVWCWEKDVENPKLSAELRLRDSVPADDTVITHEFPSLWSRPYQSLFTQLSMYWQAGGTNWLLRFIGLRRVEG